MYETAAFLHLLEEFGKDKGYTSTETSSIQCEEMDYQRTLAIVKPEAMKYQDVICRKIIDSGFYLIQVNALRKELQLLFIPRLNYSFVEIFLRYEEHRLFSVYSIAQMLHWL